MFKNKIFLTILIVAILLVSLFMIMFDTVERETTIKSDGELLGYRGLFVIDNGRTYQTGQRYEVKYTFFMFDMIDREISLVE